MSRAETEKEIQAKGLTAPRVTPKLIDEQIAEEYTFTAASALKGTPGEFSVSLGLLTFYVLVLKNGFVVTGESACASPENFDAELGKKIARENAYNKIWVLEGYLLKDRLSAGGEGWQNRLVTERADLDGKIARLQAYLATKPVVTKDDQVLLTEQLEQMLAYRETLDKRIANYQNPEAQPA